MKTLIATAIIALASSPVFASSDMNDEFYDGLENSSIVTVVAGSNDNLYTEGNFIELDAATPLPNGIEIGSSPNNVKLHAEGNYDV